MEANRKNKAMCERGIFVVLAAVLLAGVWCSAKVRAGSIVGWGAQVVGGDLSDGFVGVAAGAEHSLGLKQDGSIVAWGRNYQGQCNGPSPNREFVAIAGYWHSLGLKQDGSIVAWGDNSYGQCDVPEPNTAFVAVAAGRWHSSGLKQDGSIVAWGDNSYGQCDVPEPNTGLVGIAGGGLHSLGLKQDGSIVAWGDNSYGQCNVPEPNTGFVGVAGGYRHSLGLKQDGSVQAWGANSHGQCDVPEPNTGFVAVAAGRYHSLGLKHDGSIVAWGYNGSGECDVPSPNASFTAVAAGYSYSLGLKQDGSVVAWGSNHFGQCNVPSPNAGFIAIAGGGEHSLAIKEVITNTVPVACVVGGDRVVEAGVGCEGRVVLDGSCSSDEDSTEGTNDDINDFDWYEVIDACEPNSDIYLGSGEIIECNLGLGEHLIILEVTDKAGAFDSNEVVITVEDVTPPEFSLVVEPNVLWPPNHKMVKITPSWDVSDNCDEEVEVSLVSVKSSEDDDSRGDGHTSKDIRIGDDGSIYLRAERSGKGTGRVYTITYQAVDESGNVAEASATVTVRHRKGPRRLGRGLVRRPGRQIYRRGVQRR